MNTNRILARNKTILQGFEWYSEGTTISNVPDPISGIIRDETTSYWKSLAALLPVLSSFGITSIWIPPACKATNPKDEGYGIYDLYDLGEFDTKGSVGTKWGNKQELQDLCKQASAHNIGIVFDAVLNHKAAADASESASAIRVNPKNRTKDLDHQPRTIESWTKFDFAARNGKYSNLKYNKDHFSAVDWDSRAHEKAIFKFVGTRSNGTKKDWAKDVGRTENGNYDYLMFCDVDFGSPEVRNDVKHWATWLLDQLPGVTGMRLDAIKHYSASFQKEFIAQIQRNAKNHGKDELFFVGEYWLPNSKFLHTHIDQTFAGALHLFDVKLMYNFHDISIGRLRDLCRVFHGSLVALNPTKAVTFVTNHDTQETQSLASPIEPWFIPHAYALILLRAEGHPCVFWGDLYGTGGPQPRLPACGGRLIRLVKARSLFAYGEQRDYFSTSTARSLLSTSSEREVIAWSRTSHSTNLVVLCSISWSWKSKRINVGTDCAGQLWSDVMGWAWSGVLIDQDGFGEFPVGPRSIGVWTWKDAEGRSEVDGLVYPEPEEVPVVAEDELDLVVEHEGVD